MTDSAPKTGGFFSRWSQRREQVAAEEVALKEQAAQASATEATTELPSNTSEAKLSEPQAGMAQAPQDDPNRTLTAEDLPNPEEIEIGGSFASFMAPNVDPVAKTAALRALWKQPHFNEIDGLLEYALDYSNQPKLSPNESAELVQKIFRYVTKDEDEEGAETAPTSTIAATDAENTMESKNSDVETELATTPITDNLDEQLNELAQNAPELSVQASKPVV